MGLEDAKKETFFQVNLTFFLVIIRILPKFMPKIKRIQNNRFAKIS